MSSAFRISIGNRLRRSMSRAMLQTATIIMLLVCGASFGVAQKSNATAGAIKGKVGDEKGKSVAGANVSARQGEREVASVTTNGKGEFVLANLAAGRYTVIARKDGLQVGTITDIEVKSGKTISLRDNRLLLPIDESSLAILRGSVFNEAGLSVRGANIEIARIGEGGNAKRFDARLSNETGQFGFRLSPEAARYRVTVKADGAQTLSREIAIDGAAIYRESFVLKKKSVE